MDAAALARHDEQLLANTAAAIAPHSETIGGMLVTYAEPGSWLNQCWKLGIDEPVSDDHVDQIIAFFDSHECAVRAGLTTLADPSAQHALAGRGFDIADLINVFHVDLGAEQTIANQVDPAPAALDLLHIDREDDTMLDRWAELSARGFSDGEPPSPAAVRTFEKLIRHDGVAGTIATVGDTPAAAAAMALNDGQGYRGVSLFGTSVLPGFRRMGIQQHLMASRLERARDQGASIAQVASLPGVATERNARRFGFELSYVKINLVRQHQVARR